MDIDLDLYRHEVRVSSNPLVRLSAIDISPDHSQRTFVFIHGFGGQAAQWHYQLQKFSLENRVIALDMRGHGLSDAPAAGYSMDQAVADIETVLVLLKVKGKFVVVGHSFGGAWGTEYAIKNPDRVEQLVLIARPGSSSCARLLERRGNARRHRGRQPHQAGAGRAELQEAAARDPVRPQVIADG